MENNEMMNYEDIEIMDDGGSGIGTGVAMLIGAGLTFVIGAGFKLGKKAIAAIKAKKELRKPDKEIELNPEDIEEVAAK